MTFNSSTSLYQNSSAEETLKEIFCTGTRTVKVRKIQIDAFCLFSLGFGLLNRLAYPPGTCFYCNVKCQIKSKLWFHQSTYQGFQMLKQKKNLRSSLDSLKGQLRVWKPSNEMTFKRCYGISRESNTMDQNMLEAKRNHTKRLLAKTYYPPQSKVIISLRLVQNACRNWAIAPGVIPRGPKYAQDPLKGSDLPQSKVLSETKRTNGFVLSRNVFQICFTAHYRVFACTKILFWIFLNFKGMLDFMS